MKGNILIVDDNPGVITALSQLLEPEFGQVMAVSEPELIPGILELRNIDVILMDMNFRPGDSSGEEGLRWLKKVLQTDPDGVVVMITAYGEVDLAVRAIKGGANDFILKPWNNDKLIATIRSGVELRQSRAMIRSLRHKQFHLSSEIEHNRYRLLGESEPMLFVKNMIGKVAATDSSVLVLGENGTGKELIAREIHRKSARKDEVFVHVDLGSLSETLFESELFGYMKGAFTGAAGDHAGRFEVASGGTLFLDEIGNLSPHLQSKLLAVIENREVHRLGSNKPVPVDVRIICATNTDLKEMIAQNRFREDLYYRINTIEITSPPLRDRKGDILTLAEYFLEEFRNKHGKEGLYFAPEFKDLLLAGDWPGNIRQLRNFIERAVILTDTMKISPDEKMSPGPAGSSSLARSFTLSEIQKGFLLEILEKNGGNIARTARELGVARSTIYNKLKKYEHKTIRDDR
jgi:DNA-binding NtrC family response regulator